MARKYQHTMELLPQIKEMLAQGMTRKQVEDALGLSGYRPVHALLRRERKKEIQGISKRRGRKPAKTLAEYKHENKRLKMENELLRVMKKYCLLAEIRRARKWVQMEEQAHKYENLLNREFQADHPNRKWVTDISYIHTKQ